MTDPQDIGAIKLTRSASKGLLGLMALLLVPACTTTTAVPSEPTALPADTISADSRPQSQAERERAGGRWQQLGLIGMGCNLPASDGGQPCAIMQDCQGLCLPDDPRVMTEAEAGRQVPNAEYIEQVNESGQEIQGVCSDWLSIFGCVVVVDAGKYQEICID